MVKEKKTNFEKYAYAALAGQLSQSEDGKLYLGGALDLLEKNIHEEELDLYKGYINDGQIESLINIENKKFQRKLGEAKVSELYSWYEPALNEASDEQKSLIKAEFDKFSGENYGKVMEKYLALKEKAESKTENFTQKEKEKAEKEIKKYQGFMTAKGVLEGYTFENMRAKAVKESKKKNFGSLEKMLKGEIK